MVLQSIQGDRSSVKYIDGHKLSAMLKNGRLAPSFAALLAYDLETGTAVPHHLTRQQSIALTKASEGYVATVARLTPAERQQVERSWLSLSEIHNRKREPNEVIDQVVAQFGADAVIARIGCERALAVIDRMTQPDISVASVAGTAAC